jgi:hypothetical protein
LDLGPFGSRPTWISAHLDLGPLGSYKSQKIRKATCSAERQLAPQKGNLLRRKATSKAAKTKFINLFSIIFYFRLKFLLHEKYGIIIAFRPPFHPTSLLLIT